MAVLVCGVPDYRSDQSSQIGVSEAVAVIRAGRAVEPKWVGAFTPIAFWSDQMNAMSWRPLVAVGAGTKVALSQKTDGQWDTVLLDRWWIHWMTVTPPMAGWPRPQQRYFAYSMDDEGCGFELEFASAAEARVFTAGMDENAVGQAQSISTMPIWPVLNLFQPPPKEKLFKRRGRTGNP